jgi:hypothetical protein
MAYSCRYQRLVQLAVLIEKPATLIDESDPCDRPAVWATKIHFNRDGQDVDTTNRLCEHHDAQVRAWPGLIDEPERVRLLAL